MEIFDGAYEASKELELDTSVIYRYCSKPDKCIRGMYWSKELIVREKKVKEKKPKEVMITPEMRLRKSETKEETRKRLGLSPYADWCTPEGWREIEDRVKDKLEAIGYYDEYAIKKLKSTADSAARLRKTNLEGRYVDVDNTYIDPEFQTYFRQIRK